MPKKTIALDPPLSPTANIHVGLLQKASATFTSAKWSSALTAQNEVVDEVGAEVILDSISEGDHLTVF